MFAGLNLPLIVQNGEMYVSVKLRILDATRVPVNEGVGHGSTPGKRDRRVPILVQQECKIAMDLLLSLRSVCGLVEKNDYFFASEQHPHM